MANMNIDILLKKYKLNQKELADATGINENTISRYCNGTFKKIDKDHIDLICKYFKCTPNDIFDINNNVDVTPAKTLFYNEETNNLGYGGITVSFGYDVPQNKKLFINNNYPLQSGVNYERIKENPQNTILEQETQRFYSNLLLFLTNYNFPDNLQEYINKNLSVAVISFNSVPLNSFIFKYSTFLWEALSYTPYGNDFTPTLNYLNSIYYQGGINTMQEFEKQNLINSFQYFYDKYWIKQKD